VRKWDTGYHKKENELDGENGGLERRNGKKKTIYSGMLSLLLKEF
jgi:hypothetical protein